MTPELTRARRELLIARIAIETRHWNMAVAHLAGVEAALSELTMEQLRVLEHAITELHASVRMIEYLHYRP